jgi:hypothetical protein
MIKRKIGITSSLKELCLTIYACLTQHLTHHPAETLARILGFIAFWLYSIYKQPPLLDRQEYPESRCVPLAQLITQARSGDLLLSTSERIVSSGIRAAMNSRTSHIGVLWVDPETYRPWVASSISYEFRKIPKDDVVDYFWNSTFNGVQLIPLEAYIKDLYGSEQHRFAWRSLKHKDAPNKSSISFSNARSRSAPSVPTSIGASFRSLEPIPTHPVTESSAFASSITITDHEMEEAAIAASVLPSKMFSRQSISTPNPSSQDHNKVVTQQIFRTMSELAGSPGFGNFVYWCHRKRDHRSRPCGKGEPASSDMVRKICCVTTLLWS